MIQTKISLSLTNCPYFCKISNINMARKPIDEEELVVVKKAFDNLHDLLRPRLKGDDEMYLLRAYDIALKGHWTQRRKSGEPYILHPIEVARICFEEIGLGPTAVISAILHDVVEDTSFELKDIEENFTPKITLIVNGLTKLDGLYNVESPQAENFKKVISTLTQDVRVVLIKMADRIHNLRTIDVMPRHKQLKIAAETSYIYAPLAHRLGLYSVKTEFQDIIMKINEPDRYTEIAEKLASSEDDRQKYISEFIHPLHAQLEELGLKYRVLGRPKAIYSIYNKIKKKGVSFEEIYDLFAVRIILDVPIEKEKTSCWNVYSVITDFYRPIPERLKDWVTTPKGNGYESLHTTVVGPGGRYVEVQIRTERMDDIAERGFAAHWKYKEVNTKKSNGKENVYERWLDSIREMLDNNTSDALEFLNDFKTNLFNEEIYVYTPTGDMRILPKGATALDFAFDIHSDVGYRATAIKVNNKLVPMGFKLQNGDQLHVTTNKNQKPKEEWLKMVVTGKARAKIRSAMKEEKRRIGEIGKESLQRKLKNLKVDFDESIDLLVKHFGFINRPDLYFAFSQENLKISDLKVFNVEKGKLVLAPVEEEVDVKPVVPKEGKYPKRAKAKEGGILINGESADNMTYELAKCCKPVQGDDIFAYLTSNTGMKIHRTVCKNATHLMANFGYRVMKAEWQNNTSYNFAVDLLITGIDSGVGVIQLITNEISTELGLNIRSFSIEGKEGYFEGKIGMFVINKNQLNKAVHAIEKLDGVQSVKRIEK